MTYVFLYVGSFAGSLIAMLMARRLHLRERFGGFIAGGAFAAFVGPSICEIWFKQYDPKASSIPATVCLIVGLVAVAIIPTIIESAKKYITAKIEKVND